MNKKFSLNKLLPVWLAISAVFILAGAVLMGVLGFNHAAELSQKSVEIEYGVVTQIAENGETSLQEACTKAIENAGVKIAHVETQKQVDSNSFTTTVVKKIIYTFSGALEDEKLASVASAVESAVASFAEKDDYVAVVTHVDDGKDVLFESYWRGGIAIGVAFVVALVYLGIRFGVGSALTGLVVCAHDALLTACLFAITRIPVYFYAPLLYCAIAAVVSLLLWTIQCAKMKENFKNPAFAAYTADEAIDASRRTSRLVTVIFAAALALIVIVAGAVATAGSRLFFLPALLPVVLPLYSSLVVGPALHVHVKAAFDKWKENHKRNQNKPKTAKPVES